MGRSWAVRISPRPGQLFTSRHATPRDRNRLLMRFGTRNMRYTDPNWRWNGPAIPSVKPPFRSLDPGEDGTVWVQTSQPGVKREDPGYDPTDPRALPDEWREPVAFGVFDEEGRYLGPALIPEGFSTYPEPVFTRDWVLATVRDAYDVQTVVTFRVDVGRPDSP